MKIENPNLRIQDVLLAIKEKFRDGFTSRDLALHFKITINDASCRLGRLRKFGTIRKQIKGVSKQRQRGRPFVEYQITRWGLKTIERWKHDNRS